MQMFDDFFCFLRASVCVFYANVQQLAYDMEKNAQKKEGLSHDNPIFINLKSNTMKNTMQNYCF